MKTKLKKVGEKMIQDFNMGVFKYMENEKVKYLVNIINSMSLKDKLRL